MQTQNVAPVYDKKYADFSAHMGFLVKSMAEGAGSTVNSVANSGGAEAVQALFDAVMDAGHKAVLVKALSSPSMSGWVREKLEVFLYGSSKQFPALLAAVH